MLDRLGSDQLLLRYQRNSKYIALYVILVATEVARKMESRERNSSRLEPQLCQVELHNGNLKTSMNEI